MSALTGLKIGEVSKQTDVAVGALRYYEKLGLLNSVRGANGYRYYASAAIQQVQFIKKAQSLGFSLEDIRNVLNVHQQGDVPCDLVQILLDKKIEQLKAKIREMETFKDNLEKYRNQWNDHKPHPQPGEICPLIETIPL